MPKVPPLAAFGRLGAGCRRGRRPGDRTSGPAPATRGSHAIAKVKALPVLAGSTTLPPDATGGVHPGILAGVYASAALMVVASGAPRGQSGPHAG